MPLYDYVCRQCGEFTAWGSIQHSSDDAACPDCGQDSRRVISAPRLAVMSPQSRVAHERNEKSANEPMHRRRSSCGCTGSHTCGSASTGAASTAESAAAKPALQRQTKGNARPWMLGH